MSSTSWQRSDTWLPFSSKNRNCWSAHCASVGLALGCVVPHEPKPVDIRVVKPEDGIEGGGVGVGHQPPELDMDIVVWGLLETASPSLELAGWRGGASPELHSAGVVRPREGKGGRRHCRGKRGVPLLIPGLRLATKSGLGEPSARVGSRKASGRVFVPARS